VTLPAVTCEACGYDFKLGRKPAPPTPPGGHMSLDEEGTGRTKFIIIGAVVAAAIALVLVLALSGSPEPAAPLPGAPAGGGASVLAPSPSLMDSPLMRPQKPIGAARNVAGQANENNRELEETYQETRQDGNQ
jgi:hypothetical protein